MVPQTATTSETDAFLPPMCSVFRRFIKRNGLKFTPERAKILDAVLSKKSVFEAEELLYEMRHAGHRVSKATIYRTLKHLIEAGIISEVLLDNKQAHYELSYGKPPKGHLVCAETHRVVEFDLPELAALCERVCKLHGYDPVSSRFVIYGISPEARQSADGQT